MSKLWHGTNQYHLVRLYDADADSFASDDLSSLDESGRKCPPNRLAAIKCAD